MLLNPKNTRQKMASSKISGLWSIDKFHNTNIPILWLKVDVHVVHMGDVPLMHPHEANDQVLVWDVIGTCALWN